MIKGKRVVLCNKRMAHARNEYRWGSDEELARLDAAPPLIVPYSKYYMDYADEIRHSDSSGHSFAIETHDGIHIGNCGYYSVDEVKSEVEVGIIIGNRDYWDKGYGTDAVRTLVDYIFQNTTFKRIYLKSLEWNTRAHQCFRKCGFTPCGQRVTKEYNFMLMEIYRGQWERRQQEAGHVLNKQEERDAIDAV